MEEKQELGEKPQQEVAVWGLGLTNNKLDQLIKLQDRNNFLLSMVEKKIDKVMEKFDIQK